MRIPNRLPLTALQLSTAVLAMGALLTLGLSQAKEIDVTIPFDLKNSYPVGPGGWNTQYINFSPVFPLAGDTLVITVKFIDSSTGYPQRLQITNLGSGISQEIGAGTQGPELSVKALISNSFTFNSVLGRLLTNPVVGTSLASGSGVGVTIVSQLSNQPLTLTSFNFAGMTWRIDFATLAYDQPPTYSTGNSFNVMFLGISADQASVVPEPLALLEDLQFQVKGVGPGTSLADKVMLAQTYYAVPDIQSTCGTLAAFVHEVGAQSGKKIDQQLTSQLIGEAQRIETVIACK